MKWWDGESESLRQLYGRDFQVSPWSFAGIKRPEDCVDVLVSSAWWVAMKQEIRLSLILREHLQSFLDHIGLWHTDK